MIEHRASQTLPPYDTSIYPATSFYAEPTLAASFSPVTISVMSFLLCNQPPSRARPCAQNALRDNMIAVASNSAATGIRVKAQVTTKRAMAAVITQIVPGGMSSVLRKYPDARNGFVPHKDMNSERIDYKRHLYAMETSPLSPLRCRNALHQCLLNVIPLLRAEGRCCYSLVDLMSRSQHIRLAGMVMSTPSSCTHPTDFKCS
jgi:hypothetical protein